MVEQTEKTYYDKANEEFEALQEIDRIGFLEKFDFRDIEKIEDARILNKFRTIWLAHVNVNNEKVESEEEKMEKIKVAMRSSYETIIQVLKQYVDLKEEYYSLVATWIIGTYFYDKFPTYPYLFVNAMRGSGKSRLLKLVAALSRGGIVLSSPTEAVLFRMPKKTTLCIDEFEGINRKGNEGIREILNASYKRGGKVRRMKQRKTATGTEQVIEEFETYKPICIANIYGQEEVLADRCITMILDKSQKEDIMHLIEDFEEDFLIKFAQSQLSTFLVYECMFNGVQKGIKKWNLWVKMKQPTYIHIHTLTTLPTQPTQEEIEITAEDKEMFDKIYATKINGRNLELFFPLMYVAKYISEEVFDIFVNIAGELTKEKKKEEMMESKDVCLIDFVSQFQQDFRDDYKKIKFLTDQFKTFINYTEVRDNPWLNEEWLGRALNRLGLIVDKRRQRGGIEVTLNIPKAIEKMRSFK